MLEWLGQMTESMQILARLLQPAAEDKNEERASMFAVLAPIPPEQLDKED